MLVLIYTNRKYQTKAQGHERNNENTSRNIFHDTRSQRQQKRTSSDLYKPEIPKPKRHRRKERKEYEQKYLSRYKQPKSGVKKSTFWTHTGCCSRKTTLKTHFNAKRRAKQNEIREYEQKYLSRIQGTKVNQ